MNRTVQDVFAKEFHSSSTPEGLARSIAEGRIAVDGVPVTPGSTQLLKNQQVITHKTHRHEHPVDLGPDISPRVPTPLLLANQDSFVALFKVPGVPVHALGPYHYNSTLSILEESLGTSAFIVHRLDRPTSGVLIMAKSSAIAAKLTAAITAGQTKKVYLARVRGLYPKDAGARHILVKLSGVSHDTHRVSIDPENGKEAHSIVTPWDRESWMKEYPSSLYEPEMIDAVKSLTETLVEPREPTSIVAIELKTGRTHQIRAHLAHIGYPIWNDELYANESTNSNSNSNTNSTPAPVTPRNGPDGSNRLLTVEPDEDPGLWVSPWSGCPACPDQDGSPPTLFHETSRHISETLARLDLTSMVFASDLTGVISAPLPDWAT